MPISAATRAAASPSTSATTTHAPSAARRWAMARPMPDPAPVTKAIARGERPRRRPALQLGLLQRPVLDAELLGLRDRRVGRDRLGAAHHVDGVDVELARHPGGLLVGAEREHADAGHEHDGRIGAAHRPGSRAGRGARSRRGSRRGRRRGARAAGRSTSSSGAVGGRSSDERAHLGAQEVVGARRAQRGEPGEALPAQKSSTTSLSVKCPTWGRSVDASPRITGASAAARARRSAGGQRLVAGHDRRRTARPGPGRRGTPARCG